MTTQQPGLLSRPHSIRPGAPHRKALASKQSSASLRAPPLPINKGEEVIVVNTEKSNLSWKRYKLLDIHPKTGQCVVQGINDSRQRTFSRSAVKPKHWISLLSKLFQFISSELADNNNVFRANISAIHSGKHKHDHDEQQAKDHRHSEHESKHHNHNDDEEMKAETTTNAASAPHQRPKTRTAARAASTMASNNTIEFHSFRAALRLLGVDYEYKTAMKVFKSLDVNANGCLSFQQWLNWIYGLGRTTDRGKILTTIECLVHCRLWHPSLPFAVYIRRPSDDNDDDDDENANHNHKQKQEMENGNHHNNSNHNSNGTELVVIDKHSDHRREQEMRARRKFYGWKTAQFDQSNSDENVICLTAITGQQQPLKKPPLNHNGNGTASDSGGGYAGGGAVSAQQQRVPVRITLPNNTQQFLVQLRRELSVFWQRHPLQYIVTGDADDARLCNMAFFGAGKVGKTSLLTKWISGNFPHEYDPTIQDHFRKPMSVSSESSVCDILDTAGQTEFSSMRYDWLQSDTNVIFLCFSQSDHASFQECQQLLRIIYRLFRQQSPPRIVPIVLVSTKTDLWTPTANLKDTASHENPHAPLMQTTYVCEVTEEEVMEFLDNSPYGGQPFIKFVSCSAFADENVETVFATGVELCRHWRRNFEVGFDRKQTDGGTSAVIARKRIRDQIQMKLYVENRCCMSLISLLNQCCPVLLSYFARSNSTKSSSKTRQQKAGEQETVTYNISRVTEDKFSDDLQEPVYSARYFYVARVLWIRSLLAALVFAIFFPFVLFVQTVIFVFYCSGCKSMHKILPVKYDYTDMQVAVRFDILSGIVGRDPRLENANDIDIRKWFLSQMLGQKIARLIFGPCIIALFAFSVLNAREFGINYFRQETTDGFKLAVIEFLGPLQLYGIIWFILSLYIAFEIKIKPEVPSMQSLRPFVMYFGEHESLRTTAYVFLRGFAKSTLDINRLEASRGLVISSCIIALVWSLLPGVVRVAFDHEDFWLRGTNSATGSHFAAITAFIVNVCLVFALALGIQMQLLSGLSNYVEWMEDVTAMLDTAFASQRDNIPFLSLARHNNALAWIEIRCFLYTKGLLIFSQQEIWVIYLMGLSGITAIYTLYRLLLDTSAALYESASFDGILFMFLAVSYSLYRFVQNISRLERLQKMQISLLTSQKYQISFKKANWHPPIPDGSEGGDMFEEYEDELFNLQMENEMEIPVDIGGIPEFEEESAMAVASFDEPEPEPEHGQGHGQGQGQPPAAYQQTLSSEPEILHSMTSDFRFNLNPNNLSSLGHNDDDMLMDDDDDKFQHVFSAEYLRQSEKFVESCIGICTSQDIVPRVFTVKMYTAVSLTLLATICAVVPTAFRMAFGVDSDDGTSISCQTIINGTMTANQTITHLLDIGEEVLRICSNNTNVDLICEY